MSTKMSSVDLALPLCEEELEEIQGMLEGMSSELSDQMQKTSSPTKRRPSIPTTHVFTSRESYTLNCSDDEFHVRLANMSGGDLEKTVKFCDDELMQIEANLFVGVYQTEERIDEINTQRDKIISRQQQCYEKIKQMNNNNNVSTVEEPPDEDDFFKMLTASNSFQDEHQLAQRQDSGLDLDDYSLGELPNDYNLSAPPKPERNKTRQSVRRSEFNDMTVEQLQIILKHNHIGFANDTNRENLIELISSEIIHEEEKIGGNDREHNMTDWNPTTLLKDLFHKYTHEYLVKRKSVSIKRKQMQRLQGYLEKLPKNQHKKKAFKGWKKRYFKFEDVFLCYYEVCPDVIKKLGNNGPNWNHTSDQPLGDIDLRGAKIGAQDGKMISITSKADGNSLLLRCSTQSEVKDWLIALRSAHVVDQNTVVKEKDTVIIDIGSTSIRAGQDDQPQIVFPAVIAVQSKSRRYSHQGPIDPTLCACGYEALLPSNRRQASVIYPLKPSLTVDQYAIKVRYIPLLLDKVFKELKISPSNKKVIISCPKYMTDSDKEYLLDYAFSHLNVASVCMQEQAVLALYNYSATTGIIVDIGDHLDVIPIVEGTVIRQGASSLPFAGQRVTESLSKLLAKEGYRIFSDLENYVLQYIKEEVSDASGSNDSNRIPIDISRYQLPYDFKTVEVGASRCMCVEGLFTPSLWGCDHPSLQAMLQKAVLACDIHLRKEMCKNIFLSGGSTLIKGFPERLETEVKKCMPNMMQIKVNANATRLNAAYKGASILSRLPTFNEVSITRTEWSDFDVFTLLKRWRPGDH